MSERKKSFLEEEEHASEAAGMMRWLLTYADMITLLLGLFIVLVATRVESEAQFKVIAAQAARVFGGGESVVLNGTKGVQNGSNGILPYFKPKEAGKPQEEDSGVTAVNVPSGTLITMSSGLLFDSGSAELKPKAKEIIDRIYKAYFENNSNNIMISGHTDDRPMHSAQFPSNWELSTGRAGTVARYLMDKWKVNPDRMSTAGYADTDPVAPNDTDVDRAKNRRVEVLILRGAANRMMKRMRTENKKSKDVLGGAPFQ